MKKLAYSMIPQRLHFVITGEVGAGLSFVVRRDHLVLIIAIILSILITLTVGTWLGIALFQEKKSLALKTLLQADALRELSENFDRNLKEQLVAQQNVWRAKEDAYHAEIQHLKEEKENIICRYEEEIASADSSAALKIADLLAALKKEKRKKQDVLEKTAVRLLDERSRMIKSLEKTAVRLNERSRMIESVMSRIGVDVKVGKQRTANSGGPFIAVDKKYSEILLTKSDNYIETIKKMPLGYPVKGKVTSDFGPRSDPFNNRLAFHPGIDLKGKIGQKIKATADGIVKTSSYEKNGFGNYVILRHGNGYETVFGHLSKRLVKEGVKVQRGQVLGLLGNTGRSTGPHLHYEVRYNKEPINPNKYLSVAQLSFTVPE
ncbi:MAG: M23 family metallopeptidase [Candidatus Electrothrix sp. AS4_5]|nr:M23 family metallopeptidase [Candidatus Electrothrix gigas]MCI5179991.1 M23 family metallopeptidase [Candidatus Electrothrix gigas]MCI5189088.1 M23 family metallopeptidase [Candidatus Electrothrix gigas]MCI5225865.1 M23 family metallopeptidase [Candidatus Electrothrix gigas]